MVHEESVLHVGFDGAQNEYCPYTETSKTYDTWRKPLGVKEFLGALALSDASMQEQAVLDIGCGTGTFLQCIHKKVGRAVGCEYNDGMLEEARKNLGEDFELKQGSADALPYDAETFDACSINQVVHHFPRENNYEFLQKSFAEAFRVLKPGGVLHINTSAPEQQRDGFWWLSLFPEASEKMMARFPPIKLMQAHLKEVGFILDADSLVVPLERTLIANEKYLENGVDCGFEASYRNGDSSWAMAENTGELEAGLNALRKMKEDGTAEEWLAQREALRLTIGQATFITVRKP